MLDRRQCAALPSLSAIIKLWEEGIASRRHIVVRSTFNKVMDTFATTTRPADLPDFRKPPVAETVLSLQFEPIAGLTPAHVGILWQKFRREFPLVEEHPPLPPVFESFSPPSPSQVEVHIDEKPPSPRMWLLNDAKTELIQVQNDRFIHNWRKMEGVEPYPRYEPIRARFCDEVAVLQAFLSEEKLGTLTVNQCEVTYINHIERSGVWERQGQLGSVFSMWAWPMAGSFLPEPEDAGLRMRLIIPEDGTSKPIGRLHVIIQPAFKRIDNSPIFMLNLTARGGPIREGIEGAFAFFDLGRQWIVKGFADLTTPAMHQAWERIYAK